MKRWTALIEGPMLILSRAVVRLLSPLVRPLGGDPAGISALLAAQVRTELRRQRGATDRNTFLLKLAGGLFTGTFLAVVLFLLRPPAGAWMTISQSMVLALTVFTTLEAAPHLLADRRDLAMVSSAPLRDATFVVARILAVVVLVGVVIASQVAPTFVVGIIRWPQAEFLLVHLIASGVIGLLGVFCTLIIYLAILRLLPARKAREGIVFVQILLTITLFGALQLAPHLVDLQSEASIEAALSRSAAFGSWFPPRHAGEWLRWALGELPIDRALLLRGLLLPAVAGIGLLVIASTRLLERLRPPELGEDSPGRRARPRAFLAPLAERLLPDPVERVGYDLFRLLSRRERGFRLRTYPMLAFSVLFGVGYLLQFSRFGSVWEIRTPHFGIPVYLTFLYTPIFVLQARFSDDGEAGWLFDRSPIPAPGRLLAGMGVGLVLCFLLPVSLVSALGSLILGGPEVLGHVGAGLAFVVWATLLSVAIFGRALPFAEPFRAEMGLTNVGILAFTLALGAAAIALHFLLGRLPGSEWGLAVLYLLLARRQLRRLRELRPRAIVQRWFPAGGRSAGDSEERAAAGT